MSNPSNDKHFAEHHEYVEVNDNGIKRRSYQPAEYVHQEFPKVVGQNEDGQDVVVNSKEEELRFRNSQKAEAK